LTKVTVNALVPRGDGVAWRVVRGRGPRAPRGVSKSGGV